MKVRSLLIPGYTSYKIHNIFSLWFHDFILSSLKEEKTHEIRAFKTGSSSSHLSTFSAHRKVNRESFDARGLVCPNFEVIWLKLVIPIVIH